MNKNSFVSIATVICMLFAASNVSHAAPSVNLSKTPRGNVERVFFGRPNCPAGVSFNYVKPAHKVENYKNIQGFTKRKLKNGQKLGGQTRFSGLTWTIKNVKTGCGSSVEIRVQHRAPVRVIMPAKSTMLRCNYDAILRHELEHVKIYRDTPQEYEKKFKAILSKAGGGGTSLNSQLARLSGEISADMKRRNDKFHDRHGAIYLLKRNCG